MLANLKRQPVCLANKNIYIEVVCCSNPPLPRDVADTKMRAWKKQMANLPRHKQLEAQRMQVHSTSTLTSPPPTPHLHHLTIPLLQSNTAPSHSPLLHSIL